MEMYSILKFVQQVPGSQLCIQFVNIHVLFSTMQTPPNWELEVSVSVMVGQKKMINKASISPN